MISFLGWTLVHAAWQGGIIAAAVAAALWLMRRASASARYIIALVGLALTVTAPIATTFANNRSASDHAIGTAMRGAPIPTLPNVVGVGAIENTIVSRGRTPLPQFVAGRIDTALPWLVAAWLFGVAVLSIRVLGGVANVRRLGHRGVSTVDARVRSVADLVAARLGIRFAVRVLQSIHVDVPMVVGWLKPTVLVPVGLLASVAPAQLEMLLAHELAHIRRYDTIVNLAQTIVETLLFYHPAVWWISGRVREERENCCDDLAIAASGHDRRAYGAMLVLLEESRIATPLAVAATDGSLLRRVRRIVLGPSARVELGATWFAGVATMLTVLFVLVPRGAPAAAPTITPRTPPAELALRQQVPPPVQPPSRRTPMRRPSLLAGVAALTVAAANVTAQTPPNLSGRWVLVAGGISDAIARASVPFDSSAESLTIEQTERTLTFANSAKRDQSRLTFLIEGSDGASVRVRGPFSFSMHGMELTVDTTGATPRVRAQWAGGSVDLSSIAPKFDLNFGTITLSLDSAGELRYQLDIAADGTQPAKQVVQRFRRA